MKLRTISFLLSALLTSFLFASPDNNHEEIKACHLKLTHSPYARVVSRVFRSLMPLRYNITTSSPLNEILKHRKHPEKGILFLGDHPSHIDPFIKMHSLLLEGFYPRPVMRSRNNYGLAKMFSKSLWPIVIQETEEVITKDGHFDRRSYVKMVLEKIDETFLSLNAGVHILLYPTGHIKNSPFTEMNDQSFLDKVTKKTGMIDIIIIRQPKNYGSSTSHGNLWGKSVRSQWVPRNILSLLLNLIFFVPKRDEPLEFELAQDFPWAGSWAEKNKWFETIVNKNNPGLAFYVPRDWIDRILYGRARILTPQDRAQFQ